MNFRLVESSEKERILNFFKIIDEEFIPPLSVRVKLDEYSNKLASSAVNYFLVSDGSDVAHAAFYCNDSKTNIAFISSIGVVSEFQGSGIAGHLLQKIIETCVVKRMEILRLEVDCGNLKAVKFYERHGFDFISENFMQKILPMAK